MTDHRHIDVIVLGSGFGGSLLSAVFSREGLSVAVIDRHRHPRFAIGESSTPAADLLLQQLATRYGLSELQPLVKFGSWRKSHPELLCGCKRGFSYFWHADEGGFRATADHQHELLVAASESRSVADTQWYRPDIDQFLATVARNHGTTFFEEANVTEIEHPRPHKWLVTFDHKGTRQSLHTGFLIDATGPAGVLMRRLGIPDRTDRLQTRSSAVYSHWDHIPPLQDWLARQDAFTVDHPYPAEDAAVHHLFSGGWLWQLRFENGLTSAGYVFADDGTTSRRAVSDETLWESLIERRPVLEKILGPAAPAAFPGRLFCTGRLQRLWEAAAGEDWAALPHTVGFIDPLHSTGIAHTISGIERLSRILLESPPHEREPSLRKYSREVINEIHHIDRLVAGCYTGLCDFRLFTAWCMLYFAAATTFERRRLNASDSNSGFLCADDAEFVQLVSALLTRLNAICRKALPPNEEEISAFCDHVKTAIRPYNHVGLFEPAVPNMYRHTAAEKRS